MSPPRPGRRATSCSPATALAFVSAAALTLSACSTANPLPSLGTANEIAPGNVASTAPPPSPPAAATPPAGDTGAAAAPALIPAALAIPDIAAALAPGKPVVGTPTEIYTRVARGVLTCWFGAAGPLKQAYIYHADAAPASKGGQAEIEIFIKDTAASDPRGLRAYRIDIAPTETKPKVAIENIKIPGELADRFARDVERWAADEAGCGEEPVTAGWSAAPNTEAEKKGKDKGSQGTPPRAAARAVVPPSPGH